MKTPGLLSEIKNNPKVLALVIAFHLGLVVMLSISLFTDNEPTAPAAKKHNIIDAVVVDAKLYDEREKQKKLAARKKRDEEKRKKAAQKRLKQQQALEKKKQEQKKLAEARRKKELARKKAEARKKQLVLKKKKEEERKKREALKRKQEAERLAREKKARERKLLEEKKRQETERKRREEEEKKRRAEEKAEFQRALLEEDRRREEEVRQAARLARLQTQREQYIMMITQKVENSWLRPADSILGESCDVMVTQTMTGDVIDVKLQSCSSSQSFKDSVVRAVYRASPLPQAPNPDVFDNQIFFTFKPKM